MTATAPRLAKITLRDFRAFPGNETCTFDLGADVKNLLLFGENGSGKSSVFHALRLLLSETPPLNDFAHWRHVFTAGEEGTITIELTAGTPKDFSWDFGEPHPASDTTDASFAELARRATFLDYKALLRTSFLQEEKEFVDLFPLLVQALVRDAKLPDGRTVAQHWDTVRRFRPPEPPPLEPDEEPEEIRTPNDQINEAAEAFRQQLDDFLNVSTGGNRSLIDRANGLLKQLTGGLEITTEVGTFEVAEVSPNPADDPHTFTGAEVRLTVTYAGHTLDHPAVFLNEGRLTAIGLAVYLAAALVSTPATPAGTASPLLVLDDALIGLDLSNRLPLLDVLNGDDFKDWQILLMTYDANWFDLASDHLPEDSWARMHLNAKIHSDGWDMPVLVDDATYLARASSHIQSGDPKTAGVYLRSAWRRRVARLATGFRYHDRSPSRRHVGRCPGPQRFCRQADRKSGPGNAARLLARIIPRGQPEMRLVVVVTVAPGRCVDLVRHRTQGDNSPLPAKEYDCEQVQQSSRRGLTRDATGWCGCRRRVRRAQRQRR